MKFTNHLLVCFISYIVFARSKAKLGDLKVEILHKEEQCDRQTQNGDYLTIDYVGKLAADGKEFDSR